MYNLESSSTPQNNTNIPKWKFDLLVHANFCRGESFMKEWLSSLFFSFSVKRMIVLMDDWWQLMEDLYHMGIIWPIF